MNLSFHAAAISLALLSQKGLTAAKTIEFETCAASDNRGSFKDLKMVSRTAMPYGLDKLNPASGKYGYGYGMGALERAAYDYKEKYLYGLSEQGVVTVLDFNDPTAPMVLPEQFLLDFGGSTLTDVKVCPEKNLLFVSSLTNGKGQLGEVLVYSTYQRDPNAGAAGKALISPVNTVELLQTVGVGYHPDNIVPNHDCSILAVANEGEGTYDDTTGLNDPVGSTTLIYLSDYSTVDVPLNKWTDDELIGKGVHLPLPLNALKYWSENSALKDDLDFSNAIANYETAMNLEPEYVAWSADGKHLYVNLQENSAVVTIDVEKKKAVAIDAYGLKDWSMTPIDIFKDKGCAKITPVPGLFSARNPDAITSVVVDGETFVLTADEGDDKEYGDYEEKVKAADLFSGEVIEGVVPNYDCSASEESQALCDGKLRLTVGSSSVDYSDPTAPVIEKIVAFGGRGMSIFKAPASPSDGMTQVFDSKDDFEQLQCKHFPWAHNSVQDEEFSPVNGVLYNSTDDEGLKETLRELSDPDVDGCEDQGDGTPGACPLSQSVDERSEKDGPAPETIIVAEACDRLLAVTASEKGSTAFVYDITDIDSPSVSKVFHLSMASKDKSAGLAYGEIGGGENMIGEIDSETMIFVPASESPTGNAGLFIAGAWSGTISFWEFECADWYTPKTAEEKEAACSGEEEDKCYNCKAKNPCSPLETAGKLYYAHCIDRKYVQCAEYGQCFVKKCPTGLLWDDEIKSCAIPE